MTQPNNQVPVRCSSCGQPFPAQVRTILDAQADPQGKALLMADRLNKFQCPNCGFLNEVLTPLLYHDGSKQLLIAFIPMQVSLQSRQPEEKIVGDMLNELTRITPKEQFRSYMFNPKRALTMQGLMEQVMEADGVTKEMLDIQRRRVDLIQTLLAVSSEEALVKLIKERDAEIDLQFFQTISLMTQRVMQDGREDVAQGLLSIQEFLLQYSSYGLELAKQQEVREGTVREVASAINGLGAQATRADLITLALTFAEDDERLQAMVGLVRGAFDAPFFTEFTQMIGQAPASERPAMEKVRDTLQQLVQVVDQQAQAAMQQSAQFLQAVINSQEPDALLAENADLIDNTFMSILSANIQEAERRQDARALQILTSVYEKVVNILQGRMSPELRFVNELLSAESEVEMLSLLEAEIGDFDITLLDTCDSVEDILRQQGQDGALQRLALIRGLLTERLG